MISESFQFVLFKFVNCGPYGSQKGPFFPFNVIIIQSKYYSERIILLFGEKVKTFFCDYTDSNSSKWISLKVHTSQSREYKEKTQFKTTCYTDESCTLYCCNIDAPNVTSNNVTWHKVNTADCTDEIKL